jgi:dTDP-4-dehydrorhamnose reductase
MGKKRVLIFGGTGMLGSVFLEVLQDHFDIISLDRTDGDILSFPMVLNQISSHSPDVILNFAAYTDVERAEGDGMMDAYSVNALGAQNIAKAASAFGIPLVFLSTDYVFDGKKDTPYLPSDHPHPINNYGMSKYLGEELTKREYSEAIIVRTSALYGGPLFGNPWAKRHFINSLLERLKTQKELSIVSDSFTLPTSCADLSKALWNIIDHPENYEWEILHLVSKCDDSWVSWYEYATELEQYFPELNRIIRIASSEYVSKVERPKHSVLNNTSDITLPHWKEALWVYCFKREE